MDCKTIKELLSHFAKNEDSELGDDRADQLLGAVKSKVAYKTAKEEPAPVTNNEIMTMEEAAAFFRVTIEELEDEFQTLPVFSIGGQVRIRRSQLLKWIEDRERMMRGHRVLSLVNE